MIQKLTLSDYHKGKKRVNISLRFSDFEDLVIIAKIKGIENPGTLALSMLVQEIRKESAAIRKTGYDPNQQNLFNDNPKKKHKNFYS
jgi:hypothetical protein